MWTEDNEKEFQRLTKLRKDNIEEINKQKAIKSLEDLIKLLKNNKSKDAIIVSSKPITDDDIDHNSGGYHLNGSIIGERVIITRYYR